MNKRSLARVYRPTPQNLTYLARRLRAGELVAVPSETVYGLAANALDARACKAIFQAKGRPATDPLIVHVHRLSQLFAICCPNDAARLLAERFWPGPLTLVMPKTDAIDPIITAGRDSVAVRIPRHRVFRELLQRADIPLAAPSANPFGYISPTTAAHVRESLGSKIGHIIDGGQSNIGLESTIVDLRKPSKPVILRPGAITAEQISQALGSEVAPYSAVSRGQNAAQLAPGLLARHYSPRTPVTMHEHIERTDNLQDAYLFIRKPAARVRPNIFWLDARGNLESAARRLFATLREIDTAGFKAIHVELAPGDGLAVAINDRLKRAAAQGLSTFLRQPRCPSP